jgi:hypothetical protein
VGRSTYVLQIKVKALSNNKLIKPVNFRPTEDIDKALEMLQDIGFDRSKFIRLAIEEKLYRDFRPLLKKLRSLKTDKNIPDWAK